MRRSGSVMGLMCLCIVLLGTGVVHGQSAWPIVAWGYNEDGQCDVPEPNADFVAAAGGGDHSLGLRSDGTIVGWGWNLYGSATSLRLTPGS